MTPQTILIVKDKKPTSAVRDGVSINFTITKAGYDQLVLSHPNRYEIIEEYKNKKQLSKRSNPPVDNIPAVPPIVEIKDGLNTATELVSLDSLREEIKEAEKKEAETTYHKVVPVISTDCDVKKAIEKIEQLQTVDALNAFFDENEDRKTVIAAYEKRYNELPE